MMIKIMALIILQESHTYNQTNRIIRPSSSEKGSPSKRISPSSFPLRPSPSPKIHPQNNIPRPRPFFVNLGSSTKGTCNKDWKQGIGARQLQFIRTDLSIYLLTYMRVFLFVMSPVFVELEGPEVANGTLPKALGL